MDISKESRKPALRSKERKEKLGEVREIFIRTGNRIFVIDKSKSPLSCFEHVVSNLVTALLSIGTEYFEKCGVKKEEAIEALLPLIRGNIEKYSQERFFRAPLQGLSSVMTPIRS